MRVAWALGGEVHRQVRIPLAPALLELQFWVLFTLSGVLVTQSCPVLCEPADCCLPGFSVHGSTPGKNSGAGCHSLLQKIFLIQGSNPCLLRCRQTLYCLSHRATEALVLHQLPFGLPPPSWALGGFLLLGAALLWAHLLLPPKRGQRFSLWPHFFRRSNKSC